VNTATAFVFVEASLLEEDSHPTKDKTSRGVSMRIMTNESRLSFFIASPFI